MKDFTKDVNNLEHHEEVSTAVLDPIKAPARLVPSPCSRSLGVAEGKAPKSRAGADTRCPSPAAWSELLAVTASQVQ